MSVAVAGDMKQVKATGGDYGIPNRSSRRTSSGTGKGVIGSDTTMKQPSSVSRKTVPTPIGVPREYSRSREEQHREREKTRLPELGREAVTEFGERERDRARKRDAYASLSKRAEAATAGGVRPEQRGIVPGSLSNTKHRAEARPPKRTPIQVQSSSIRPADADTVPNIPVISPSSESPTRLCTRTVSDPPPQSQSQPPTAFPPLTRIRTTSGSSSRPTLSSSPRSALARTTSAASSMPTHVNTPPPRYSSLSSRPPSRQSQSEERSRTGHGIVERLPTSASVSTSAPAPAVAPGGIPNSILRKRSNAPKSLTVASSPRNVSLHPSVTSSSALPPRSPRSPSGIADLVRRLSKKRVRFKSVSSRRTMSDRGTPYASPEGSPVRGGGRSRRRGGVGVTPLPPLEGAPLRGSEARPAHDQLPVDVHLSSRPSIGSARSQPLPSSRAYHHRAPNLAPNSSSTDPPPLYTSHPSSRSLLPPRRPPSPMNPPRIIPPTPTLTPIPINPPRAISPPTSAPTPVMHPPLLLTRARSPLLPPASTSTSFASGRPRVTSVTSVTPSSLPRARARTPSPTIPPISPPQPLGMQMVGVEGPYPPYSMSNSYLNMGGRLSASVERGMEMGMGEATAAGVSPRRPRVVLPPPAPALDLRLVVNDDEQEDGDGDEDEDGDSDEESVGVPAVAPPHLSVHPSRSRLRRHFRGMLNVVGRIRWRVGRRRGGFDEESEGYDGRREGRGVIGRWWMRLLRGVKSEFDSGMHGRRRVRTALPWSKKRRGGPPMDYYPSEPMPARLTVSTPPLPPLPQSRTSSPVIPSLSPSPPPPPPRTRTPTPPPPPLPAKRNLSPPPLLHPLLRAPTRSHSGHLTWDMRYPDLPPHYAGSPFIKQSLSEPATDPPSERLTLLIPIPGSISNALSATPDTSISHFWTITLYPRPGYPSIRCIDLLKSTASMLRTALSPAELASLSAVSSERLARVERAFQERCRGGEAMGQRGEDRERRVGWRKVDLLGGGVVWRGVRWIEGVGAWERQGMGSGGWVVELDQVE